MLFLSLDSYIYKQLYFALLLCALKELLYIANCIIVITATKSDMWLEIDPRSGRKLHTISSDGTMSSCPATESYTTSVLIARTGKCTAHHLHNSPV